MIYQAVRHELDSYIATILNVNKSQFAENTYDDRWVIGEKCAISSH